MARPQGAGILADLTACKALDRNCSKVRPSISTLLCIHLRWTGLTTYLIPCPFSLFFSFPFFPFRSVALAEGRQEETPQWACQCLRETLLYPHGFFLFPVWSAGGSFSTSCQSGASATRPHCLLHTDLILRPQWDLFYCYYSLPCFFFCLYHEGFLCFQCVVFCCSNTVFVNRSNVGALPLCCLQQWSAQRTWLSSAHVFYAEVKTEMLHVRNVLRFARKCFSLRVTVKVRTKVVHFIFQAQPNIIHTKRTCYSFLCFPFKPAIPEESFNTFIRFLAKSLIRKPKPISKFEATASSQLA